MCLVSVICYSEGLMKQRQLFRLCMPTRGRPKRTSFSEVLLSSLALCSPSEVVFEMKSHKVNVGIDFRGIKRICKLPYRSEDLNVSSFNLSYNDVSLQYPFFCTSRFTSFSDITADTKKGYHLRDGGQPWDSSSHWTAAHQVERSIYLGHQS